MVIFHKTFGELNLLRNLKTEIDPRICCEFKFGSIDAWDDYLLESCFCDINSFSKFLAGGTEILIGSKGAGKSAIFRLISEGKRTFSNPKKLCQIIISINEVMEYSAVRSLVNSKLGIYSTVKENEIFYFWEIYILYRLLGCLKKDYLSIYEKLSEDCHSFTKFFEVEKPTILDFLKGIKGTAGVKFDISNPNLPYPDFYISAENRPPSQQSKDDIPLIKIDSIKKDICKQLEISKSVVYVLVDNLDDFASREEFDSQKLIIQGLVEACKYYTKLPGIKIKVSLRPELYEKINFAKLGGRDKIEPRVTYIEWKAYDIRKLVAERIMVNLTEHCVIKNKHLQIELNEHELYRPHKHSTGVIQKFIDKIMYSKEMDIRDARKIDSQDKSYQEVITSIFPREVRHLVCEGKETECDLFEYLETHFCYAGGVSTPRIYIAFLVEVFSIASEHYSKNERMLIKLDKYGEYPLIKREFILEAYGKLQKEVRKNYKSSVDYLPWRKGLGALFNLCGCKSSLKHEEITSKISENTEVDVNEFLAFCSHLGILKCENEELPVKQRSYNIPILIQSHKTNYS